MQKLFEGHTLPIIAATDNMRLVPDQIRQWIPSRYVRWARMDLAAAMDRAALRGHFEVDRRFIVLAALKALADEGSIDRSVWATQLLSWVSIRARPTRSTARVEARA